MLLFLIAAVLLFTQEHLQGRASTGKPPSQDERELIVDRQSSSVYQKLQQAQLSLPVLMDGEPSTQGGRCLFQTRRMLRRRLSRCFHQYSSWQLPQMPSPIYQLVYELQENY